MSEQHQRLFLCYQLSSLTGRHCFQISSAPSCRALCPMTVQSSHQHSRPFPTPWMLGLALWLSLANGMFVDGIQAKAWNVYLGSPSSIWHSVIAMGITRPSQPAGPRNVKQTQIQPSAWSQTQSSTGWTDQAADAGVVTSLLFKPLSFGEVCYAAKANW